jgi:undecaprenyl-diphosphatase
VAISVVLHLGTLLATIIFFGKDILNLFKNFKQLILIAMVVAITGVIGILGKNFFESLFNAPRLVALAWIFTGCLLISTKNITQLARDKLKITDAFILGLVQGLAIIPGISRSGITISTLFFRKINRRLAFVFSFLISIPVILGAVILEVRKIEIIPKSDMLYLGVGFIFSFLIGLVSLSFLKVVIDKAKFYYFGYYCLFLAAATLLFIK